jgi:hypothetical protein
MCDFEREGPYPLESQAPLADVHLPGAQGLTLEDLEQWHAGVEPTLQLEDALAEKTDAKDDIERPLLKPVPAPVSGVRVLKKGKSPKKSPTTTHSAPDNGDEGSLEALNALLAWQLDSHHYALNKREDLKRLSKQSDLLLQKVPQYLERLTQVLHAHEQCQLLYARLAELSEKRGAAALIIQTARQVEVLEKNLKEKRFRAEELKKIQADLSTHLALTERYQAIFQQVKALQMLNLD